MWTLVESALKVKLSEEHNRQRGGGWLFSVLNYSSNISVEFDEIMAQLEFYHPPRQVLIKIVEKLIIELVIKNWSER
jgi:hypothetical protein